MNYSDVKLGQPIEIVMRQILRNNFAWFGGRSSKPKSFLIYQSSPINQKPVMMSSWYFTLLNVSTDRSKKKKKSKYQLKINSSHYVASLS